MASVEIMVDNNLLKVVDLLLKGNLKDQDVIDDIKYIGEVLEKNIKILTYSISYIPKIFREILKGTLIATFDLEPSA